MIVLGIILAVIGLIAGISSIKDAQRTKKLEQETAEKKEGA
jgi:hypothetical protein